MTAQYRVTDKDGREIHEGDTVTNFRGERKTFGYVTRGVEYNGTAKVVVDGFERYAHVYDLTVETIAEGRS